MNLITNINRFGTACFRAGWALIKVMIALPILLALLIVVAAILIAMVRAIVGA